MPVTRRRVSGLFLPEPHQWGLRGGPCLWGEMRKALSEVWLPNSGDELVLLLEKTFADLVGVPLNSSGRAIFVERYAHGGMSSGLVSFAFWRARALSLLRSRYIGACDPHG